MKITDLFESATAGGTSSGSVATVSKPLGKGKVMKRRADSIFAEEEETVIELSNEKLGQYKKAAGAQASAADKAGDYKKGDKRFKGIVKATNKQFANDAKKTNEAFGRRDAYQRDYDSSVSGMGRGSDHRGLGQELAHETNNLAISINGKVWKVVPGRGTADSREEWSYLNNMKGWAEKKSAATGKKWSVSLTGAPVTESLAEGDKHSIVGKFKRGEELYGKVKSSFKDIGDAQKKGDHEAASKAFKKHEKYANLRAPGTFTKVKEDDLNELNYDTLRSYSDKADDQIVRKHRVLGPQIKAGDAKAANKTSATIQKRMSGIDKAAKRMNKDVDESEMKEHKKGVRAVKTTTKPRNFVAKNAVQSGAGAHKDKKKAAKQGDTKHKSKEMTYESRLFAALDRKLK